jgi:hypothetical protein
MEFIEVKATLKEAQFGTNEKIVKVLKNDYKSYLKSGKIPLEIKNDLSATMNFLDGTDILSESLTPTSKQITKYANGGNISTFNYTIGGL